MQPVTEPRAAEHPASLELATPGDEAGQATTEYLVTAAMLVAMGLIVNTIGPHLLRQLVQQVVAAVSGVGP